MRGIADPASDELWHSLDDVQEIGWRRRQGALTVAFLRSTCQCCTRRDEHA